MSLPHLSSCNELFPQSQRVPNAALKALDAMECNCRFLYGWRKGRT